MTLGERLSRHATGEHHPWSALREGVSRHLVAIAAVPVAALLVVLFYFPVATVLLEAILEGGHLTGRVLYGTLTDEYYFGWFARLFEDLAELVAGTGDPATALRAAPGAVAGWLGLLARDPHRALLNPEGVPFGLVGFTAYQAGLSALASVLLGLPAAYVLSRYEFPGRGTLQSLTMLPFVMPGIAVAIGFYATFGRQGALNDLLHAAGLPPVSLLFTVEIIVLAHAFYNAPLVARMTTAAWETVDARAVETARSLGADRRRAVRDVVLPQLLPAVLAAALLAFVFSFLTFPIVLMLGGYRLATVEVWVYRFVDQLNVASAAGLATVEAAISIGLTALYLRYEAGQRAAAGRPPDRVPFGERLTPGRVAAVAYGVLAAVVFAGPVLALVLESLTADGGLSLANYAFLLERQATAAAFQVQPLTTVWNSLVYAVGALLLALPLGVLVAVVSRYRGGRVVDALAMAPIAVSGIVVGLGLLQGLVFGTTVFGHRVQLAGAAVIVGAHAVAGYPFVTRNVAPMLGALDDRLVESARSLGATRARALLDVELPLVAPGIIAGAAFAFAISIGEFDATIVLAQGPGQLTMPVAIERLQGRRLGPATAMAVVLLAVTAVSFVVIDRLGGGWMGRG